MKLKPIKDKKKIDVIFEKGTILRGKSISIKFYNFNDNSASFGLAVPKKKIPLAVSRNLIKRRLREQIRLYIRTNAVTKGVSFFLIYNTSRKLDASLIQEEITFLLKKV